MVKRTNAAKQNGRREIARLVREGAFKNLAPGRGREEVMIHVYWSAANDAADKGHGHIVQRGRVTADLGLDAVPDPPFTASEMEDITRAAKLMAIKCLVARKRR